MEYQKIISITGISGLFEVIASKNDGAVVKSLEDKTTKFVSSRVHQFSQLDSIEIYTVRENVNLVEVFQVMNDSTETLPAEKDPKAVKAYFEKVYADIDFDRVYNSDLKKIVKWFSILKSNNVEFKIEEEANESTEEA